VNLPTEGIAENKAIMFLGYLSAALPELHSVEAPRLLEIWDEFKAEHCSAPEPSAMHEALADVTTWLESALNCKAWVWDSDQRLAAMGCVDTARRILGQPLTKGAPLSKPPCSKCGYNGPGYFQPDTHPCASGNGAGLPTSGAEKP
jgi:hypothetical protein